MFTLAKSRTTKVNKLKNWNTKTLSALRLAANAQKRLSVFKLEQEDEEHRCFRVLQLQQLFLGSVIV